MGWFQKEKVVVPVDFSEPSLAAAETALEMVQDPTHLHVINVLSVLTATEPGVVWDLPTDETRREHVMNVLKDHFADAKFDGIHLHVAFGDPGQEIAEFAKRVGAELIVVPSSGRTGLKHLLIGSVAERVCRLAHCPVLVLRQ